MMEGFITKKLWEETERLRDELHDIAMRKGNKLPRGDQSKPSIRY
jgi:hypothetical protein